MQGLLTILPMAFVMSAGPQIVTAIFLATSRDAKRNSLAFLLGAAAATTIGVTVFYFLGGEIGGKQEDSKNWLDWLIIGLLVFLAVRVYVKRKETKPPKWMGRLEKATVGFAVSIGFVLYLLLPTDLISMATVGAYVARQGEPWWHVFGFVVLTVLIAALPLTATPHGAARGDAAAKDQTMDERQLVDRQRGRDPLLPCDGVVRLDDQGWRITLIAPSSFCWKIS